MFSSFSRFLQDLSNKDMKRDLYIVSKSSEQVRDTLLLSVLSAAALHCVLLFTKAELKMLNICSSFF